MQEGSRSLLRLRDRPVAAEGFYTIGGKLQDEVIYADAYPSRIPPESGGMLQGLPLSSVRCRLTTPRGPVR